MDRYSADKAAALKGEIVVPGDKSMTHRAIILGSMATGDSRVEGFLAADDCLRTMAAFQNLGIQIKREGNTLLIKGAGPGVLDLGNSGTGIRLLAGVLAGHAFFSVLTGDSSLRRRPMKRVADPLREMGAQIMGRGGSDYAPLAILGGPLKGLEYTMPIPSAQVKSALLLAGLQADGRTVIREPARSRDHTERMLKYFGVDIKGEGLSLAVQGPVRFEGCDVKIPGDLSSAAFIMVAASVVKGSEVRILGVGVNPTRTGILEILHEMGADIRTENTREMSGEPVADLVIRSSPLKGILIEGERMLRALDEFPILCVAAALAQGETIIRDAKELRVKESDRIAVMTAELTKMGCQVEEREDGVRITGKGRLQGASCDSQCDHRVALALSVAAIAAKGESVVRNTECIETSFPGFFALMESLKAA